jgi:DNA-binding response OmpR family regulator
LLHCRVSHLRDADVKILVAEDDRVMSLLVCSIVREAGHTPLPAYDAMQTMMFAVREPVPGLIILDINMPGGSGLETLRKLKLSARTASVPVIVLSGSDDPDLPKQAKSHGADEFLAKPINPEVLTLAIQRVLRENEKSR